MRGGCIRRLVLTPMWLICNRIYHKFAKTEYVTAKFSNSPVPVSVPGEVNIERERFKMKVFGNFADSHE